MAEEKNRGPGPGRAPVMADVAALAGVSHQTVSRVINGQAAIRPATRARVEEAIRTLGYRPNRAARALVTNRSGIIGIVGTDLGHWGPASTQRTVEAAVRESGYVASSVSLREVTPDTLAAAFDHLARLAVEGVVLIAAQEEALAAVRAHEPSLPLVVVEGDLSQARWTVGVDQVAGARQATRHLLELGHRTIAHLAGPVSWTEAVARREGWRAELRAAGCEPGAELSGDWSARSGYLAGQRLVQQQGTTAVFCANDQMALGLLRALAELGRRVPAQMSVVGFDDVPESAYLIPPLTTVRQDVDAVGRRAIEVLQAAIAGRDVRPELIQPELVVRASTAAVPSG